MPEAQQNPGRAQELISGARRWLPNLMILAGLAALPWVIANIRATEQKFNSPFDQIDYDEKNQQGLLPVLRYDSAQLLAQGEGSSSDEQSLNEDLEAVVQPLLAPTLEAAPPPPDAAIPDLEQDPGLVPERLLIPAIELYVQIVRANYRIISFEGENYQQWEAPNKPVAGWQTDSAGLGVPGNTVLYGHHNVYGKVFEDLHKVRVGQVIQLKSGDELFTYRVVFAEILEEKYQPLEVRLENARWLLRSTDERITLITCWPETGNSHRVVVVAVREAPEASIPVSGAPVVTANPAGQQIDDTVEQLAPSIEDPAAERTGVPPDLLANPGLAPERLLIPIIGLYAPVLKAGEYIVEEGEGFRVQWWAPSAVAAGWQPDSAGLGVPGITVLYGHLDVYGAVFAGLPRLQPGQVIQLKAGEVLFSYRVVLSRIFAERCPDWTPQSEAARWVLPSSDERITLVTCYPAGGYTHRIVVVAARE